MKAKLGNAERERKLFLQQEGVSLYDTDTQGPSHGEPVAERRMSPNEKKVQHCLMFEFRVI